MRFLASMSVRASVDTWKRRDAYRKVSTSSSSRASAGCPTDISQHADRLQVFGVDFSRDLQNVRHQFEILEGRYSCFVYEFTFSFIALKQASFNLLYTAVANSLDSAAQNRD